jgi:hypothetical protein
VIRARSATASVGRARHNGRRRFRRPIRSTAGRASVVPVADLIRPDFTDVRDIARGYLTPNAMCPAVYNLCLIDRDCGDVGACSQRPA